jgi:uncharacterized protein (TIGR00255 family)
MNSMTGFGQAAGETNGRRIAVSVQTVNHRHLDLALRLPEDLRGREGELRERIAARLGRGRCELTVELPPARGAGAQVDLGAARGWITALRPLIEEGLVEPRLTASDLVRLPGVIAPAEGDSAPSAEEGALLDRLLGDALDQLAAARAFEGARIAAVLERTLGELGACIERLAARRAAVAGKIVDGVRSRLAEILGGAGVSEERLAQEAALLAERSDVREELDRLRAHVEQFAALSGEPGPVGRRLDFLIQEIARELNTLGAKSRDAEMAREVVEAKGICEQLREQVQNVE